MQRRLNQLLQSLKVQETGVVPVGAVTLCQQRTSSYVVKSEICFLPNIDGLDVSRDDTWHSTQRCVTISEEFPPLPMLETFSEVSKRIRLLLKQDLIRHNNKQTGTQVPQRITLQPTPRLPAAALLLSTFFLKNFKKLLSPLVTYTQKCGKIWSRLKNAEFTL